MNPNELFNANTRIVYDIFWKYFLKKTPEMYQKDIIQEGLLELWRVSNSYDKSLGYAFSSYAYKCVYGKMQYFYRNYTNTIRITRTAWEKGKFFKMVTFDDPIPDTDLIISDTLPAPDDDYEGLTEELIEQFLNTIPNKLHRNIFEEYLYGNIFFENPNQMDLAKKYHLKQATICRIILKYKKQFKKFLQ